MFNNHAEIILASGSPRRKRFLEELGLLFSVQVADVDETARPGERPEQFVRRLALEKAEAVAPLHREAYVIGADTVVVLAGKILGKPDGSAEALTMLQSLSGRTHEVWTGFAICRNGDKTRVTGAVRTEVTFIDASDDLLAAYVGSGEPLDKAGAYGIQGRGGLLVASITGSYSNVVGLPMAELVAALLDLGAINPLVLSGDGVKGLTNSIPL
ncbi:MAG: septum formation inhibitor Maf [Proteobacteria bacterium]|nr:septum formation inhibitor Maf [Pseudomonadota bacterium]MBU1737751.1 septum formation inhibitor Maf [Pseudomonadota bacterium]